MLRLRNYLRLGVIVGPLPFNIVDGQIIDAVPVMADFNWIVSQVNANAAAGSVPNALSIPTFVPAANVGGSGNAITLAPNPAITGYAAGQRFSFVAKADNTGAVTVATSGLSTRALVYADGTALGGAELLTGGVYDIEDNGSIYNLMNSAQGSDIITFVPTITFGGAAVGVTYSTQTGTAFKLGRLLFFSLFVQLSNKGSSTGQLRINALPYTINAGWTGNNGGPAYVTNVTFTGAPMVFYELATTRIGILDIISASNFAAITDAECTNTSSFAASMFYAV